MLPSAKDEELLAEFLLQWEELGNREPAKTAASRLAAAYPHLIPELEKRIQLLVQMAWLDHPVLPSAVEEPDDGGTNDELLAGRYRLIRRVSNGWGGILFHALDLELQREVAIKSPRTWDESAASLLLHEARCASQLRHPGIVPVYDVVRDGDRIFVVYEYVKGQTLSQMIASGPVPWREALEITRQIVEAICRAHAGGLLHRDIKPSNILIDFSRRALLADFGSAIAMTRLAVSDSLGAGSVAYTAPEIIRGEQATPEADYYSIGMVLFSMLQGSAPCGGLQGASLRRAVLSPVSWEFERTPAAPVAMVALCKSMIAKKSVERLADAESILKMIRKITTTRRFPLIAAVPILSGLAIYPAWVAWKHATPTTSLEVPFEWEHEPSVDGSIGESVLKLPVGLAFAPDGTIVVANTARGNVCRFRRDGGLLQRMGRRGSGLRLLFYPHGVAVSDSGTVYVTDHGNHVIHAYDSSGELLYSAGGYGSAAGHFIEPHGIAIGKDGRVFVGDSGNKRVQILDARLQWTASLELAEFGIKEMVGLLAHPDGRLFVSDTQSGKIWVISSTGELLGTLSAGPSFRPLWLTLDSKGNIWVGHAAKGVVVFDRDLKEKIIPGLDKKMNFYPQGLGFGPKGELAIVNYSADKIIMLNDLNGLPTGSQ